MSAFSLWRDGEKVAESDDRMELHRLALAKESFRGEVYLREGVKKNGAMLSRYAKRSDAPPPLSEKNVCG